MINGLEWYLTRSNHGRGKLSAEANRLRKAGLISLRWLSRTDWVLSITNEGKDALARQYKATIQALKLCEASLVQDGEHAPHVPGARAKALLHVVRDALSQESQ